MDVFPADNDDGGYDEALAAEETDNDDDGRDLCRICRSPEGPDDPLRYGCACRGSIYFHQECLRLSLNRHGNKQCEVCRRSYSFVRVYSEKAPERLTCRDSLRSVRVAAYVFVILFNALCFSLHPWAAIVNQRVSEKYAFLLAGFLYNGLVVCVMTMMAALLRIHSEVCVDSNCLRVVAACGFWKYMGILCGWCYDHPITNLVRLYGPQKDTTFEEDIDEDRFRTLRIGLMLVLSVLSLFLISAISMAFLILVGWTFFHCISFIKNDLFGFWIGCYLLQVIHIMIRRTDLLLNLVLLWIRKPLLFSISPNTFPRTRSDKGRTAEEVVTRKRKWRSTYLDYRNIRESLKRKIEETNPCGGISLRVFPESKPCMVWEVSGKAPTEELLEQDWKKVGGPVRNQGDHDNCWTYVSDDLCSSQRLLCLADSSFRTLSARYLTFYVCPEVREYEREYGERKEQHLCHGYPLLKGLEFIRDNGGIPEEEPEEATSDYSCTENPPLQKPKQKYNFVGDVDLRASNKIEDLYEWLLHQPVGADMILFQPEYDSINKLEDVYVGPKSDMSRNFGLHSVLVLKVVKIKGKWAALVKLSHGIERGENGYMHISLSTMIVNARFSSDGASSEEEDEDDNKDEDGTSNEDEDDNKDGDDNKDEKGFPIRTPSYLLRHFTCPVIIRS